MKRNILTIGLLFVAFLTSSAQDVKEVEVSCDTPYEETIDVDCDAMGLSLAVRITYDEILDIVSLSLVPDRAVVFFRENQKYEKIFNSSKKLKTENISYPVQVIPGAEYKLVSSVYKQYPKKRQDHIYNKWMGNLSKGVTAMAPDITESGNVAPLVTTDSLYQRFQITPSISKFSFKIRNVLTVDLKKQKKNGKSKYEFKGEKDLNLTFSVTINRNPCFGSEPIRKMLEARIKEIKSAYYRLHSACPEGTASSDEEVGVFTEHRSFLLAQFPPMSIPTRCPDILSDCAVYNTFVDSIKNAPCAFIPPLTEPELLQVAEAVPTEVLVSTARKLNALAIKLMRSTDPYERRDMTQEGKLIIKNTQQLIDEKGLKGEDKEDALALFNEAKAFMERIIANRNSR